MPQKNQKTGRKPPLSPEQISVIRTLLSQKCQVKKHVRDLALFSLAIDSGLRGIDLVHMRVSDISEGDGSIKERATILQQKTSSPVMFSIMPFTRVALKDLIEQDYKYYGDYLFTPQQRKTGKPISTTYYRKLVKEWVSLAGLNPDLYGSHSLRRSKVSLVYKKTGNLRAAQVLLGHKSIQSTAGYLGIETDEALTIAEQFKL